MNFKRFSTKIWSALLILSVCITISFFIFDNKQNDNICEEYISITETCRNEKDELITTLSVLFLDEKESKSVFEFPYTAQYPLGVVDLADNMVYFSADVNDVGDQIFSYNLKTKKTEQLTDNLFAINYIIPTKYAVYFVACKSGTSNLCLGAYDKRTGEIKYWGDDRDTNIEDICIDKANEKIYLVTYSDKEDRYNLQHQDNGFTIAKHTVVELDFDLQTSRELCNMDNEWIRMLVLNGDKLLIIYDHEYTNPIVPSNAIYYDLLHNSENSFSLPPYRMQQGGAAFAKNGDIIYVTSQIEDGGKRNIYSYNLKTQEYILLYEAPALGNGFINNWQLISE